MELHEGQEAGLAEVSSRLSLESSGLDMETLDQHLGSLKKWALQAAQELVITNSLFF